MIALAPSRSLLDRFAAERDAEGAGVPAVGDADLSLGGRADHRAARVAWAARVVDEYRSVVVFTELLAHLAAAEAPYDTLAAVQRVIGDELRHTRMCARASGWFGPLDGVSIDLSGLALPPSETEPLARAYEIIARELVVGEAESVLVLTAYRDATSDPACHALLSAILADEVRHAAAGRALLARLEQVFGARLRPTAEALKETLVADRAHIRGQHRAGATGGPGRAYGASIRADEAPPSLSRETVSPSTRLESGPRPIA